MYRSGENLVRLDLTDLDSTRKFIETSRPEFLIHAAAQRFPDKMEKDPEASFKLNVESTRALAEAMSEFFLSGAAEVAQWQSTGLLILRFRVQV